MNIRLIELNLAFRKGRERIEFADFTSFHGQMGAGKSTLARLIDYCFGAKLGEGEMTPAMQLEFVSASLNLTVENVPLVLDREAHSDQVRAHWQKNDEHFEVILPARTAGNEVIVGTGVAVLSDLMFYLAGRPAPKVRRSKLHEDSDLERLSIRDLLWFCYLDQDSMDSSFFNLETDGNVFKRLKSKDVLRFIVGFHQEVVSELEVRLERIRADRLKAEAGANAIRDALTESEIGSDIELQTVRSELESKLRSLDYEIQAARSQADLGRTHAMDTLRNAGRELYIKFEVLDQAAVELKALIAKDKTHKNELLALSTRFRRSQSARAVLTGVNFIGCPSCNVTLPERDLGVCCVCGQSHTSQPTPSVDEEVLERDLDARVAELNEIIKKHEDELRKVERMARETDNQRAVSNADLDRVSRLYDSAYLSANLEIEKRRASVQQELVDLKKIEFLSRRIVELDKEVGGLLASEQAARKELREARQKAESDTKNLSRLRVLFLDCLVRAKIPGFVPSDDVEMKAPHFLPEVSSAGSGDLAVTSFANLGSGGKKTLFKCCFAIAVHRLTSEIGALLPTLLIIDSPMKNISERENREQFEGFFELLYQLSSDELRGTQFILIDKELCSPPADFEPTFLEKHMRPNAVGIDPSQNPFPPLIRYYIGK